MDLKDFVVTTDLIDQSQLTEEEQELVGKVIAAYSQILIQLALTRGVSSAIQLAIGATLRMVKANLEQGIQVASLQDVKKLTRG